MSRRSSVHEAFLQNIPLAVIVDNERQMKSIDVTANLEEALVTLCSQTSHGFKALPVFDRSSSKYTFTASRLDIISMLAWTAKDGWKKTPLLDVLRCDDHVVDPRIFSFTMNDAVVACLEKFSKGVHHILVVNEEFKEPDDAKSDVSSNDVQEQKYYWLSQLDIVEFLFRNLQRMSAIVDAPINAIGLVKERLLPEKVFTVHHKVLAKEAFKKFMVHNIDIVAIVNDKHQIVSHLSESDIVGVGPEATNFLLTDDYLTVFDFMNAVNKENGGSATPVICKKDTVFKELIRIVVERRSDHIFIVDDKQKPIKLVTVNDIICKFSPFDYKTNMATKRLSMIATSGPRHSAQLLQVLKEEADGDSSEDSQLYT